MNLAIIYSLLKRKEEQKTSDALDKVVADIEEILTEEVSE